MTALTSVITKHAKKHHAVKAAKAEPSSDPVPVQVKFDRSMETVIEAFRLNERTKTALAEYDATTLEDLAFMTNQDYESMMTTAARTDRPLCPLQQRKVAILLGWVRDLVKDSHPFKEDTTQEKPTKPNFWDRITHNPDEWVEKVAATNHSSFTEDQSRTVIPEDWEKQFHRDLPLLKRKLKEVGDTTSFSLYSDLFINIRWVICGYEH